MASDLDSSSIFYGFTNEDLYYVSSDIWEIKPKFRSCSIQIHQDSVLDKLECEVNKLYGPPQCMENNGNIYRGVVPTSSGAYVIITFYKSTGLVRVQGSGYAMWINKILPKLVDKVIPYKDSTQVINVSTPEQISKPTPVCASTPMVTSTPAHTTPISRKTKGITTSKSTTPTNHDCCLTNDMLQSVLNAAELKASLQNENKMLRARIQEQKDDNAKLHAIITEKTVQLESMMTKVADVELLEFERYANLKLLEATEKKFEDEKKKHENERNELLRQIENLLAKPKVVNHNPTATSPESPSPPTYSEVLQWSPVKPAKSCPAKKHTPKPIPVSNRFSNLKDESELTNPPVLPNSTTTTRDTPPRVTPSKFSPKSTTKHERKPSSTKPKVLLFGDSIGRRIDSQRLSRGAEVTNHCKSGQKIEDVHHDIKSKDLSNTESLILHVGTNNLELDSSDQIKDKYTNLFKEVKSKVPDTCKIGISSIILRRDKPYLNEKCEAANQTLQELCDIHKWSFIDNCAIKDLHRDRLHPNTRGMSFLAKNFQDFLRSAHPSLFRDGRKKTFQSNRNQIQNPPAWLKFLMQQAMHINRQ